MIPLELKNDKEGLLYLEDDNIFRKHSLQIDKRNNVDEYFKYVFYPVDSTDEYIIKYSCTVYTRKQIKLIKEMLFNLVCKQKNIKSVDFPIAYFYHMKRLCGLIVKYYKEGISVDNIIKLQDIESVGKYYYHDENNIRNLFMLYSELLNTIIELFDNDIFYVDLNPGNIVLYNNQVKLIDFDYRYISFNNKDKKIKTIIDSYLEFVRVTLNSFYVSNYNNDCNDFRDVKRYLKKLENNVYREKV